ncbi:trehalose-phosphatase [Jatrophihabitans endophyticus]|uniref:trehalose-phosphatase n=1 Tax=Jatrophihabitans endophyticus TaxID=1206085 RepID=UPI0013564D7E|nr:trehalose-phosphatase [Jatrophihabitans endophyticus]
MNTALPDDPAALLAALRPHVAHALVTTDFDGTLAPLQVDPEDSRAVPGTIEALTALTRRGATVAVVTGRDARTVVRLGGLDAVPGIVVAGVYGAETWCAGELLTPDTPAAVEALRDRLPATLADVPADPAVWVEDKRLSLVVHARKADDPVAALAAIREPVTALGEELGFEVHPGSGVLELRLPGFDKAGAIERLVADRPPSAVLYLGDDLGDLPAFAEIVRLRERGVPAWSVAVEASAVPEAVAAADVRVPDADAAVALLTALAQD